MFTDASIKKLKESIDGFCECRGNHHKWPLSKDLDALIERLKYADEYIEALELFEMEGDESLYIAAAIAREAYRVTRGING